MSDIAFSVIINNNGIDDIIFKTIMLKGEKGNSVDHVEKTSTSGLVDTYTIYLSDGTVGGTFTVTNGAPVNIDDSVIALDKTWSSSKLSGMIKSIDDTAVGADKLWSSQKINSMIAQTGTIENVAIASFADGADDVPVSSLIVDINAVQAGSGDPSPSNVRPISGWSECNIHKAGINLWDEVWELGSINNSDGTDVSSSVRIRSKNYIEVKPNTSICIVNTNAVKIFVYKYGYDKSFLGMVDSSGLASGNQVIYIPSDCYYLRFRSNDNYTYSNNISFNYPATDTAYHAFNGGIDTIAWSVNQWDEQWEIGAYNNDGEKVENNNVIRSKNAIPIVSGMSYYFKAPLTSPVLTIRLVQYDANMNCLSSVGAVGINRILTLDSECRYIAFNMSTSYGTTYNNDISINYPATDTAYHAYTGIGLVYGGKLNVTTGEMTINRQGKILSGDENWELQANGDNSTVFKLANAMTIPNQNNQICSHLTFNSSANNPSDARINTFVQGVSSNLFIQVSNSIATNVTEFKAWLASQYASNTPVAYVANKSETSVQLTATEVRTLLNDNNIFADTGNVDELIYFKTGSEAVAKLIETYLRGAQ